MTQDDLDRIEGELRLTLPVVYIEFMLQFPSDLVSVHLPGGRRIDSWSFTNRPARVIRLNRSVRRRGRRFDGEPWPAGLLVIGSPDIRHNFYSLTPSADGTVWLMAHEDDKFHKVAGSLQEFAERICESQSTPLTPVEASG